MAKDDYPVIVYQILSYLYNCLKKDIDIDTNYLENEGKLFKININYWNYIIVNLYNEQYIDGIELQKVYGEKRPIILNIDEIEITPKGIQYLTDNSFIKKAKDMLKDTKAIIPFI